MISNKAIAILSTVSSLTLSVAVIFAWWMKSRRQRKAIEAANKGYQIWHSSFKRGCQWRHVALFVQNHKYELRQSPDSGTITFLTKEYPHAVTDASCRQSVHVDDTDDSSVQMVVEENSPDIGKSGSFSLRLGQKQDDWQFLLIGHTTKQHHDIVAVCEEIGKDWQYNLVMNNCHIFTLKVAKKIAHSRAPGWGLAFGQEQAKLQGLLGMVNHNTAIGNQAIGGF